MNYPERPDLHQGKFSDGDPIEGIAASVISAEQINAVYDEMIAVIEGAGGTPQHEKHDQLFDAITTIRKDELYDKATDYLATQGRKNFLINGNPQIWQRGESFTETGYTADRWYTVLSGATCRRDPDPQKGILITANSEEATGKLYQLLERNVVETLRGKTLTFSVDCEVNNSFVGDLKLEAFYSNESDAESAAISSIAGKAFKVSPLTRSVESLTFNVPMDAVGLRVALLTDSTQPVGAEMALCHAQLEVGSLATNFEYRYFSEELLLCKRYYAAEDFNPFLGLGNVYVYNGSVSGGIKHTLSTPMRVTPTITKSGEILVSDSSTSLHVTNVASAAISPVSTTMCLYLYWATPLGTQLFAYGQRLILYFDAEL